MCGRLGLVASALTAIVVTALTTVVLLVVEPGLSKAEAVKTGGLAGGAVVALYALWLNDRRRRTDESRHELDREKVADERFARAVELLGHEADQVRIGAMYVLADLTRAAPRYKQTVLDILCAYLRPRAGEPDDSAEADPSVERERQVRSTAQWLISDLLPWGQDPDQRVYHLDLTGARLDHLYLSGRRIGRFTARNARFHGITRMVAAEVTKPALFTRAEFHGRVDLNDCRFEGGLSWEGTSFTAEIVFDGASVGAFLAVDAPPPDDRSGHLAVLDGTRVRGEVASWTSR